MEVFLGFGGIAAVNAGDFSFLTWNASLPLVGIPHGLASRPAHANQAGLFGSYNTVGTGRLCF